MAAGTACAAVGCTGAAMAVTAALSGEFGASTPKQRWRCVRGGGTRAAPSLRSPSMAKGGRDDEQRYFGNFRRSKL